MWQIATGSNEQDCAKFLNEVEGMVEGRWRTLTLTLKRVFFLVKVRVNSLSNF